MRQVYNLNKSSYANLFNLNEHTKVNSGLVVSLGQNAKINNVLNLYIYEQEKAKYILSLLLERKNQRDNYG